MRVGRKAAEEMRSDGYEPLVDLALYPDLVAAGVPVYMEAATGARWAPRWADRLVEDLNAVANRASPFPDLGLVPRAVADVLRSADQEGRAVELVSVALLGGVGALDDALREAEQVRVERAMIDGVRVRRAVEAASTGRASPRRRRRRRFM